MTKKDRNMWIGIVILFTFIISLSIYRYNRLINNLGYTYASITEIETRGKRNHPYSTYLYKVKKAYHIASQGGSYKIDSTVVIVYNKTDPDFSMIVDYPMPLKSTKGDTIPIMTEYIDFSWWDYFGK